MRRVLIVIAGMMAVGGALALLGGAGPLASDASAHSARPIESDAPAERNQEEPAPDPPADPESDPASPEDEPADDPEDEPADTPAEEPPDGPTDEPANGPAEEPADTPADEPAATPDPTPAAAPAPASAIDPSAKTYVVQAGDYVKLIADRHGVAIADIVRLNPEVTAPGFLIHPGQVLVLREDPQPEATAAPAPQAAEEPPAAEPADEPATPEAETETEEADPAPAPAAVAAPAAAAPAPTPQADPAPAQVAPASGRSGLVADIGIGVAGLATGIALALIGPWVRRLKRGY